MSKNRLILVSIWLFATFFQIQCASKQSGSAKAGVSSSDKQIASRATASKSLSYLHYMMGELSSSQNDSRAALEHFRYAYHFDPESETLMVRQAEQHLNLDQVSEAKDLLEKLDQSNNPDVFLLRSRVATMEFDLDSSIKALNRAEQIYESQGNSRKVRETLLTKVALQSDYRRYEDALQEIDSFLIRYPEDEIAYYFKGKIYSILRKNEEAKDSFRAAIKSRPSFIAAIKALGLRLELEGNVKGAIEVYQTAFPTAGEDKALRQKMANLYLINENYLGALEHLKQIVRMDSADSVNKLRTALVHYKVKQYDQAQALFEQLLEDPSVSHDRVHFYIAAMSEERADLPLSEKHLRRIGKDSDYFIEAQLQLSDLYIEKLKDNRRGVNSLNQAIVLKPQSKELYLALAGIHERDNRLQEAIRVLNQATKAIPDDERLLFVLGSMLDKVGDYQAGVDRMEEVLAINPNNEFALNHIGYVYAERKINLKKAEELLKKAVQLAPENGFIMDSLGWLHFQKGEFLKAKQVLERAVTITKAEPVILEHLADTYERLGLGQQALEIYRKVMRISNNAKNSADQENQATVQKRLRNKIASLDSDSSL